MFLDILLALALTQSDSFTIREAGCRALGNQPLPILWAYYQCSEPITRRYISRAMCHQINLAITPLVPSDMVDWEKIDKLNILSKPASQSKFVRDAMAMMCDCNEDIMLWSNYFYTSHYIVMYLLYNGINKQIVEDGLIRAHLDWYHYVVTKTRLHISYGYILPDMPWWRYDPPFRTTLLFFRLSAPF